MGLMEMRLDVRQQKVAPGYGGRAVSELVPVQGLPSRHDGSGRELLPGQVDRDRCVPDLELAPEVDLVLDAGPHGSLDDLAPGQEALHHARRRIALAERGIALLPHPAVRRLRTP